MIRSAFHFETGGARRDCRQTSRKSRARIGKRRQHTAVRCGAKNPRRIFSFAQVKEKVISKRLILINFESNFIEHFADFLEIGTIDRFVGPTCLHERFKFAWTLSYNVSAAQMNATSLTCGGGCKRKPLLAICTAAANRSMLGKGAERDMIS